MKQLQFSYVIAIAALVCCIPGKTFSQTDWHITGNRGTSASGNFVGTTGNTPLAFVTNNAIKMRINSNGNTGIGTSAPVQKLDVNGNINIGKGFSLFMENHRILKIDSTTRSTFLGNRIATNNTGFGNTAIGYRALFENTTGYTNTAYGANALASNTTGRGNVANGASALFSNSIGNYNTANGYAALFKNTSGEMNVATGSHALNSNTTGNDNTAEGYEALFKNTTGTYNTATGSGALASNVTGSWCTATGYNALLYSNGSENTAYGVLALVSNNTGIQNTGIGSTSLFYNSTGAFNTGVGYGALYATISAQFNTAAGYRAGSGHNNGWYNVFVGANSNAIGGDYTNVVAVGEGSICTISNQVRIGNASTASIGGYANWTNISDGRVKKNVKENVPGLTFINKLKPLIYNLDLDSADKIIQPSAKNADDVRPDDLVGWGKTIATSQLELDARNAKQQIVYTGFVAQDVEKAAKALNYDFSGVNAAKNDKDLYGLSYEEFVVPLVKAVQELSRKVEKLEPLLTEKNSGTASIALSKNIILPGKVISAKQMTLAK